MSRLRPKTWEERFRCFFLLIFILIQLLFFMMKITPDEVHDTLIWIIKTVF